ncbi:hypothetical protein BRC81_01035 [Halobacteriales archaeon QS_1_68_20]|nr:MAG: hypothetical protein BRC81_01035 [Halobacteriales archaeon QS_1_68_20]
MAGRSSDDGSDDFGTFDDGADPEVDDGNPGDEAAEDPDPAGDDDMSGVFGAVDEQRPIEPGDASVENALFVLLGILTGIASMLAMLGVV